MNQDRLRAKNTSVVTVNARTENAAQQKMHELLPFYSNLFRFAASCYYSYSGGSVAEWLACWTQAQKGLGSNHCRDAVG